MMVVIMYIKYETTNTIVIEKSKFLTFIKRVKTEQEYKDYLNEIRKKYHDASHVCSACIINNIVRSSDDGEPSGTAGAPILNVLSKNNLNEVACLVVRYFGGIKLGAGGLIRAYSNSVSECLKKSELVEEKTFNKYSLTLSYDLANKIEYYMKHETILLETKYENDITFIFCIKDEKQLLQIKEFTKGIDPKIIGEIVLEV